MNTRMTILLPRRDALSAAADSGLARTRRQNSAENRGRHRAQRSLRVRSGDLDPSRRVHSEKLSASRPLAEGAGREGEEGAGCGA